MCFYTVDVSEINDKLSRTSFQRGCFKALLKVFSLFLFFSLLASFFFCIKRGVNLLVIVNREPSQTPFYLRPINLFS